MGRELACDPCLLPLLWQLSRSKWATWCDRGLGIAHRLGGWVLSEHTVHRHLANILRKLGLSSRRLWPCVRTGLLW